MNIIFECYRDTSNVEYTPPISNGVNIMYTLMTEIPTNSDINSILTSLFGNNPNSNVDFLSLFNNIETILDNTLRDDQTTKRKATQNMLEKLGPYKRVRSDSELLDEKCSICIENYVKNEGYRVLRCKHGFHKKCIDKWFLSGSQECPICRGNAWGNGEKENDSDC